MSYEDSRRYDIYDADRALLRAIESHLDEGKGPALFMMPETLRQRREDLGVPALSLSWSLQDVLYLLVKAYRGS